MNSFIPGDHLDEGQILCFVDHDAGPGQQDAWVRHVENCAECLERVERTRSNALLVGRRLSAVELPADFPSAREIMERARQERTAGSQPIWTQPWLRAAAVAAILVLPLVVAPPLRAWVVDHARSAAIFVGDLLRGESDSTALAESPSARLLFPPAGAVLEVTFDAAQEAGEIRIEGVGGDEISLEIEQGPEVQPLLSNGRLRIQNEPASTATYRLLIPASVRRLRLDVGGNVTIIEDPGGPGAVLRLGIE